MALKLTYCLQSLTLVFKDLQSIPEPVKKVAIFYDFMEHSTTLQQMF